MAAPTMQIHDAGQQPITVIRTPDGGLMLREGDVKRLTLSHGEAKRLAMFVSRHIYEGEQPRLAYTSSTPAKIHAKRLRDDAKR
jgi:hypothetical protein